MCGRYDMTAGPRELADHFGAVVPGTKWDLSPYRPSYNIAPSTNRPVIRFSKTAQANELSVLVWGFRPAWAKRSWINARAETLFTTAAFKSAAEKRRCLVLATGWYEWQDTGGRTKQPYRMTLDRPFAFAGIWTGQQTNEGWSLSFAIVTAPATPTLERIHPRMPLVLHPRDYAAWIDPTTADPAKLLVPFDNGGIRAYPVSTYVNKPENDGPECALPLSR